MYLGWFVSWVLVAFTHRGAKYAVMGQDIGRQGSERNKAA